MKDEIEPAVFFDTTRMEFGVSVEMSSPLRIVAFTSPNGSPRFKVYDSATGERFDFDMFHLLFADATGETIAAVFHDGKANMHYVKEFGFDDS